MGRPIGILPLVIDPAKILCAVHPTTVSVGPYSLIICVSGELSTHQSKESPSRASPPMSKVCGSIRL